MTFILTFHEYRYRFKAFPFVLQSTSCMQEWKGPSTWGRGFKVRKLESIKAEVVLGIQEVRVVSHWPFPSKTSFLKCRAWSRNPVFRRAALRGGRMGKDREGREEPQSPSTCRLLEGPRGF